MATPALVEPTWERMYGKVEIVRQRLERTVRVLEGANIPYAIAGGQAVASWVARVDEALVRNTRDVDVLVRRADLTQIVAAMAADGFKHAEAWGVDFFIEDETVKPAEGVHLIFANERIRPDYLTPAPSVSESEATQLFRVVNLDALLLMKLEAHRPKDVMHIVDLMNAGLIDASWVAKYPQPLNARLEQILNDPNNRQMI